MVRMIAMSRATSSAPIEPLDNMFRFHLANALARMGSDKGMSRATVRNRLNRPRQTVDNWLRARATPKLEDVPHIDEALGYPRGELLIRMGFIDVKAVAMRWIKTTDEIEPHYRDVLLTVLDQAVKRQQGDTGAKQQQLVS